jgi:hypothetical protein
MAKSNWSDIFISLLPYHYYLWIFINEKMSAAVLEVDKYLILEISKTFDEKQM